MSPQLTQDAQTAAAANPQYQTLTTETLNAMRQWNLTHDPAVETATQLSQQFNAQSTAETCTEQTVCVEAQPGTATTATCEIPGSSRTICTVTASATVTFQTLAEGGVDWQGPIGIENAVWVRLRQLEPWLYALEVANGNNYQSECADSGVVTGVLWSQLLDFRSVVPPTVIHPSLQVTVETTGGGCGWGSYTLTGPTPFCRVLNCDDRGMQWPVIRYTYQVQGEVPAYQITDGCADVRSLATSALVRDQCLNDQPQPLADQHGQTVSLPPPGDTPAASCWQREQEWTWETPMPDTCDSYRSNPACRQVDLTCLALSATGQDCQQWQATYQCEGEPVCTRTETVRRCRTCGTPDSPIPFCTEAPGPDNSNIPDLFRTASYIQMLTDAKQDFDPVNLQLFAGAARRCTYSGLGGFIENCCSDDPDKLFGSCPAEARQLAEDRKQKKAHYVGTRCSQWVTFLVGKQCVQREQVYCVFKSQLARIVEEQGRAQLGRDWGSGDSPDCRGFVPDELSRLNFAEMDFSEWYVNMRASVNADAITQQMRQQVEAYQQQQGGGSP
jgi:conjugal transfer mating pair stabilization protein TraN